MTPSPSRPRLAGVAGWPVGQSLSPLIHQTWARREGREAVYLPLAVPPSYEDFARGMNALRQIGFRGVNVTIPHKEHALRFADSVSDAARAIGAANMLTFDTEKGTYAENSDAAAIVDILSNAGLTSGRALVLGAGGAARAALWALRKTSLDFEIVLANRTRARAEEIASFAAASVVEWEDRSVAAKNATLLINTTSLGMTGMPPLDLKLEGLNPGAVVFDIVYKPLETPLLAAARALGLRTIDGLEMLMRQAVPGFCAWLGERAVVDADLRLRLVGTLGAAK